jgi:aminoglycoside 2'-N-acetyltransferase I
VLTLSVVPHDQLSSSQKAEVLTLCSSTYDEDFTPFFKLLGSAIHVLARVDGKLVCHAAWVARDLRLAGVRSLKSAYIEAVATDTAHRGKGYASQVLASIPPLLEDFDITALSPSDVGFYEKLGWELWCGPLCYVRDSVVANTPDEQVMIYRLPHTPPDLDLHTTLMADWREHEIW